MENDKRDLIRKQQERMTRTLREAPKYFSSAENRKYVSQEWGWEDWITDKAYRGFIKKSKETIWFSGSNSVIYVDGGKLQVFFGSEEDNLDVILGSGDGFKMVPEMTYKLVAHADTYFTTIHE